MISVAIAAYNGARFIGQQLQSILNQTVPADEVVICDDCSTDKTADICRAFIEENGLSGWHFFVNEKNAGYCLNFYGAIGRCHGDIIFLADQDDVWHPDKVEKMTACMSKAPDISVLSARYDVIDADSKLIPDSGVTYLGSVFDGSVEYVTAESMIGCSYIRGFSICFRREIKEILRPVDLQSLLSHDWLICMLGSLSGGTAILNTVLTDYRYHGDNVSLAAMDAKKRSRKLKKRVTGLEESIEGHSYILSLTDDAELKQLLSRFIAFEGRRLKFLKTKNPLVWLQLVFFMRQYARYYKGGGGRVWLGDFVYAYKRDR